jgi:hypothetical protein
VSRRVHDQPRHGGCISLFLSIADATQRTSLKILLENRGSTKVSLVRSHSYFQAIPTKFHQCNLVFNATKFDSWRREEEEAGAGGGSKRERSNSPSADDDDDDDDDDESKENGGEAPMDAAPGGKTASS